MASRFILRLNIILLLAACLTALPAPASAYSETTEQVIKFYLDPALVPDLDFARAVLPHYVDDLNLVLEKNTNRRLVFNPETGIILTTTKPQSDSAMPPLPTSGFEIWAHAVLTTNSTSYGGYAGMDMSGAGVLAGLKWTRLYDPENLAGTQVIDYTIQLDHMLHELAHVFGAGIGEYYQLSAVSDTTGMEPLLQINLSDPQDRYWTARPDFLSDPLLRLTRANSRAEYLAGVRFSDLTAAVISGPYRNGLPTVDQYLVQVLDINGLPVPGANVKAWNVKKTYPTSSELNFDGITDENGMVSVSWGGSGSQHNPANFLRLLKAYKDGRAITEPQYFSIFDADATRLVQGASTAQVTLKPAPPVELTLLSKGTKDGWVRESAEGLQVGGAVNPETASLVLGDDSSNRQYRSVLSFPTAALPDNAVVTRVILKIRERRDSGANPFTTLGNLQIDMGSGYFSSKASLQRADFDATASRAETGVFSIEPVEGWYTAELDSDTYETINVLGNTQFRLRFELPSNGDGTADMISFFSGNASDPGMRPQLIIQYYLP